MSPSGFVLDCRTATSTPAPSVASVTSRHSTALTSERRIPAMKSNPAITPSTRPRAAAEAADSVPQPGATRVRARGEHGGEIVGGEGRGLPPAPVGGRAAVARHHPCGAFPGGRGLAGELGPEVHGLDGLRGGAGGAARLEHVGEVGGQARVLQGAAGEPPIQGAGGGVGREGVSHHTALLQNLAVSPELTLRPSLSAHGTRPVPDLLFQARGLAARDE